jgi:hypothetical protein
MGTVAVVSVIVVIGLAVAALVLVPGRLAPTSGWRVWLGVAPSLVCAVAALTIGCAIAARGSVVGILLAVFGAGYGALVSLTASRAAHRLAAGPAAAADGVLDDVGAQLAKSSVLVAGLVLAVGLVFVAGMLLVTGAR